MKTDPKAVAKLVAEAKQAKKHFEEAIKFLESLSAARATATGAFTNALAKIKLDSEIKESDLNALGKALGVLQKALAAEEKGHDSFERSQDAVFVAVGYLFNAQQKK